RDIFPGTLIMYGAHERYLLEQASHWAGLATRRTDTYESSSGNRSQSSQFGQMIDWQELLPQNREEAQLLRIDPTGRQRGSANELVHIPDWSEFTKIFDQAIQRRLEKKRG
ncbi:MAG TPA: type IV secretory system conjugative DNA transfer family protein, partial [Mycobacterium sp.]|nr:type IV secretory system conjugative DNA transfer family protein [Mycobacterium sp.]